jgi:AcrR family transcriptional regulator
MFRERGYAASSTRELAQRAGVGKATVYHHFPKKEDLLFEICIWAIDGVTDGVERAVADHEGSIARLQAAIQAHTRCVTDDIDMHATMLLEFRHLSPERLADVAQRRRRYHILVVDLIQDAQDDGTLSSAVSARHQAVLLLNILNWTITWFRPGGDLSSDEIAALSASTFLDGNRSR